MQSYVQLPAHHQSGISSLTFTADGSLLCSTDLEGVVALWDRRCPAAAAQALVGHQDAVNSAVAFSDGVRLATAGEDTSAVLWDVRNPAQPLGRFAGVGVGVNRLALGSGDAVLYSAADDGCIVAHDTATGAVVEKWMAAGAAVNDLCIVRQGASGLDVVVTGGEDNSVRTWLGGTVAEVSAFREAHPEVQHEPTPAADDDDEDAESAGPEALPADALSRLLDSVDEFEVAINHIHYDASSSSLLAACANCLFEFAFDPISGNVSRSQEALVYQGHTDYIRGIATTVAADGSRLAYTVGDDAAMAMWQLGVGRTDPLLHFKAHDDLIMALALSPCSTLLATGAEDGSIRVWSLPFGTS